MGRGTKVCSKSDGPGSKMSTMEDNLKQKQSSSESYIADTNTYAKS